jgi:regulator of sigma E protease
MIGGVLVNFLLALFIYSMILFYWGDSYIPVKDMKLGMKFNQEAKSYGFRDGDILLGTDKKTFKDFSVDLFRDISEAKHVDIIRDGKRMRIVLPGELNLLNMIKSSPTFTQPLIPAQVDSVLPNTPASKLGLKKGDRILAINGKHVDSHNEFTDQVARLGDVMATVTTSADSMKVRCATIVYARGNQVDTASVILTPTQAGLHPCSSLRPLQACNERIRIVREHSRWHQIWLARTGIVCRRHEICVLS